MTEDRGRAAPRLLAFSDDVVNEEAAAVAELAHGFAQPGGGSASGVRGPMVAVLCRRHMNRSTLWVRAS